MKKLIITCSAALLVLLIAMPLAGCQFVPSREPQSLPEPFPQGENVPPDAPIALDFHRFYGSPYSTIQEWANRAELTMVPSVEIQQVIPQAAGPGGTILTFVPAEPLLPETTYTAEYTDKKTSFVWQFTTGAKSTPADLSPPPPPTWIRSLGLSVHVVPSQVSYVPGDEVQVTLWFTNADSEALVVSPFPPEINIKLPSLTIDTVRSFPAGSGQVILEPGEAEMLQLTWNQLDDDEKQVRPRWYSVKVAFSCYRVSDPSKVKSERPTKPMVFFIRPPYRTT